MKIYQVYTNLPPTIVKNRLYSLSPKYLKTNKALIKIRDCNVKVKIMRHISFEEFSQPYVGYEYQ